MSDSNPSNGGEGALQRYTVVDLFEYILLPLVFGEIPKISDQNKLKVWDFLVSIIHSGQARFKKKEYPTARLVDPVWFKRQFVEALSEDIKMGTIDAKDLGWKARCLIESIPHCPRVPIRPTTKPPSKRRAVLKGGVSPKAYKIGAPPDIFDRISSDEVSQCLAKPAPASGYEYAVWYCTSRQPREDGKGFLDRRTPTPAIRYGKAMVEVPHSHQLGSIGSNVFKRLYQKLKGQPVDDPLVMKTLEPLEADIFWGMINASLSAGGEDAEKESALIFIHGYRVGFESGILRAAQLGVDLKIPVTAAFSWPSRNSLLGYAADESTIEAAAHPMKQFLIDFCRSVKTKRIHVIAHSMGNRGLLRSLHEITLAAQEKSDVKFCQIFLAAPDVDRETFSQLAKCYPTLSERTTLYISTKDRAIAASAGVHQFSRVGLKPPVTIVEGVDTVDVNEIDMSFVGHGYYAEAKPVLIDIHSLITKDNPPNKRFGITAISDEYGRYWSLKR
jgi:esterase/lipase superfamily enzyme